MDDAIIDRELANQSRQSKFAKAGDMVDTCGEIGNAVIVIFNKSGDPRLAVALSGFSTLTCSVVDLPSGIE